MAFRHAQLHIQIHFFQQDLKEPKSLNFVKYGYTTFRSVQCAVQFLNETALLSISIVHNISRMIVFLVVTSNFPISNTVFFSIVLEAKKSLPKNLNMQLLYEHVCKRCGLKM